MCIVMTVQMSRLLLLLLLLLAAAHDFAFAIPEPSGFRKFKQSIGTSPDCDSLKCVFASPEIYSIPPEDFADRPTAAIVDVLLHMSGDKVALARAAAERITGIKIDHFIPPASFAAAVPASNLQSLSTEPLIRAVTRLLPEHKFSMADLRRYFSGDARFFVLNCCVA
jgi:hypothetical protein